MFLNRSKNILEKFVGKDIIISFAGANFFGLESQGLLQFRGNGVLVLTQDEIFFEMWMPKRIYQVPIKDIVKIEKTIWHLGKSKNRLLLKVVFTNKKGNIDSIAWLTRDLDLWVKSLEQLISKK